MLPGEKLLGVQASVSGTAVTVAGSGSRSGSLSPAWAMAGAAEAVTAPVTARPDRARAAATPRISSSSDPGVASGSTPTGPGRDGHTLPKGRPTPLRDETPPPVGNTAHEQGVREAAERTAGHDRWDALRPGAIRRTGTVGSRGQYGSAGELAPAP